MRKTVFGVIFILILLLFPAIIKADNSIITYETHISNIGWQGQVNNGDISGTTGLSKSVEAYKINLNYSESSLNYQTYSSKYGWQEMTSSSNISGTTGKSIPIEAIKIDFQGKILNDYDVYYRVHVSNIGWMDWAKNGEVSGTSGYSDRKVEAIIIKLVKKGDNAPGSTKNHYYENYSVEYQSHISDIGWQSTRYNGDISGTTGKNKKIEAISIAINNKTLSGELLYQTYVRGIGWQSEVSSGNISGTTGKSKRIEAIKIRLTDDISENYNIYYRVHVSNIGWMGWTSNGKSSGTIGYNYQIEAIQIKLFKKDDKTLSDENNCFISKDSTISYSSHVSDIGWMNYVNDGDISGTTGKSKRLEALKIKMSNESEQNMISYQTHVSDIGWMSNVSGNSISGTTGKSKKIEAIRIKLNGEYEQKYDIYYRVHVENIGWMDWAKNGENAGTSGQALQVEAIQIKMVLKGSTAPGTTDIPYREAKWVKDTDGNTYYYDIYGTKVTGQKSIGGKTYYFGPTGIYLGNNNLKVIDVSAHQGNIDWNKVAKSGIYGVILRIGYWNVEDSKFNEYINEVKRLGIPYGIYIFSYANSVDNANTEADFTKNIISKYNLSPSLGIYYDLESWYISDTNTSNTLSKEQYDDIARMYITSVSSYVGNKFKVKIYADLNHVSNRFGSYAKSESDWIAQYNNTGCTYTGKYSMWQYSSKETVDGINVNVDMSILY